MNDCEQLVHAKTVRDSECKIFRQPEGVRNAFRSVLGCRPSAPPGVEIRSLTSAFPARHTYKVLPGFLSVILVVVNLEKS